MSTSPLFLEEDPNRDRAVGLILGALHGARAAAECDAASTDWPRADDVLLHLAESLVEHDELHTPDLLRRLITAWASRAGRGTLVGSVGARRQPGPAADWVVGLAPICVAALDDQRGAQFAAAQLAKAFNASSAEGEALEVLSHFLGLAILTRDRRQALAPWEWLGDTRVGQMASGRSLPIATARDLVASVDQARCVTLCHVSFPTMLEALRSVAAPAATFMMTGMLLGALEGRLAFVGQPAIQVPTRLEVAIDRLLHWTRIRVRRWGARR